MVIIDDIIVLNDRIQQENLLTADRIRRRKKLEIFSLHKKMKKSQISRH